MTDFDCAHCDLRVVEGQPDPCFGELPGVIEACCGHGGLHAERGPEHPYIMFANGVTVYFDGAVEGVSPRCDHIYPDRASYCMTFAEAHTAAAHPQPETP